MLLVITALVALVSGSAVADTACHTIAGSFVTRNYIGPDCPGTLPQCFNAHLDGDLDAASQAYIQGLVPAPTLEHPTRVIMTLGHVLTMSGGVIESSGDEVVMDVNAVGASPFTADIVFVEGTEAYAGVSGGFHAVGELDFATGVGVGTYEGVLCVG